MSEAVARLNLDDGVALGSQHRVVRQQPHRLRQCLRGEHAIERIVVVRWQRLNGDGMFRLDRQQAVTRLAETFGSSKTSGEERGRLDHLTVTPSGVPVILAVAFLYVLAFYFIVKG